MKKTTLLIFTLVLCTNFLFSQSNFDRGFESGYKKGYCYEQGIGCIEPLAPLPPLPTINESYDNYTDGYNRGFQIGLGARKKSNTNNSGSNYSTTGYDRPARTYNKPTSSINFDLLQKAMAAKQARYDRQIAELKRQQRETKAIEKEKAVNRMNQIINYYNDAKTVPSKIKDGWHIVYSMNNYDFCDQRKVYVENNKVTKYVIDDWLHRTVSYSMPIQYAKTSIKLKESENDLLNIFFVESIADPNSYSSPPIRPGSVSFWTNSKRGQIDIYVEDSYIGTLKSHFKKGTPNCGQSGTVVFQNKPGTYSYVAKSSRGTWKGTVTISGTGCSKMKLNK